MVTENGASKYSITKLAEEELPGMDTNLRSAVSIGRRLINPMAEYVKIEPHHLGVGMYQVCIFFRDESVHFSILAMRSDFWKPCDWS